MRRLPLLALLSLAFAAAAPADAAYFSDPAQTFVQSGAGPFEWRFVSSDPDGANGGRAYKLSTENVWHRCTKDYPPRLENLPEGQYSVTIADDPNLEWYSARGLLYSGWTQPCWENPTTYAPLTAPTTAQLFVDNTAPVVSAWIHRLFGWFCPTLSE